MAPIASGTAEPAADGRAHWLLIQPVDNRTLARKRVISPLAWQNKNQTDHQIILTQSNQWKHTAFGEYIHPSSSGKRPNRPTTPLNPELPYMPQVWLHTNQPTKYSPLNPAVIFWNHFSTMVAVRRARRSRTGQVK